MTTLTGLAGKKPYFLALFSGLLLFLAAPGMFSLGPLAWLALTPLLWACRQVAPGQAFRLGLAGGLLYHLLLLYWVTIVLGTYGHLPWYISGAALLLLALYMGLYLAIFAAGFSWLAPRLSPLWAAPLLWVALDFIRARLFTGFPWQDLAYSQYQTPLLIQTADLFGHAGVTFLIVLTNVLLVTMAAGGGRGGRLRPAPPAAVAIAFALLLVSLLYGGLRQQQLQNEISTAEKLPVTVVQGNIPQDQKWTAAALYHTVDTYIDLSSQALAQRRSELLVWPETALPFQPLKHPLFQEVIGRLVQPTAVKLLTGAPHQEGSGDETRYYNSAMMISGAGLVTGMYHKQHLVPFGEYIPLRRFLPFTSPLVETVGDFTPGASGSPISCDGVKIGVLICFESIFPELGRKQTKQGAGVLVVITNDAWFGRSSAPWQHLSMAVLRAVENRRSVARAANTGVSAFVDPLGRLLATSNLFEPAFLTEDLPLLAGESFYVRFGHFFPLICLLLLAPVSLAAWRQPGKRL
jgi:apolipoprotein N-acyltransferase